MFLFGWLVEVLNNIQNIQLKSYIKSRYNKIWSRNIFYHQMLLKNRCIFKQIVQRIDSCQDYSYFLTSSCRCIICYDKSVDIFNNVNISIIIQSFADNTPDYVINTKGPGLVGLRLFLSYNKLIIKNNYF